MALLNVVVHNVEGADSAVCILYTVSHEHNVFSQTFPVIKSLEILIGSSGITVT